MVVAEDRFDTNPRENIMTVISDPIADLLTRIRNAQQARHAEVTLPGSKIKLAVAQLLAKHGYVESAHWIEDGPQGKLRIVLRYDKQNKPLIHSLKRISKPSRRVYVGVSEIPTVLNGMGMAILSTSKGIVSDKDARAANMGGELICSVY